MSNIVPDSACDTRNQTDPYFFAIHGVREPYSDWKRFKDLIRSLIPSNCPGWTNTGPQTRPNSRDYWAYFSARSWSDASAAFNGLIRMRQEDGSYLGVHLLDTTGSTGQQYRLINCNCYALGLAGPGSCSTYGKGEWYPASIPSFAPGISSSHPLENIPARPRIQHAQALPSTEPETSGRFANYQITGSHSTIQHCYGQALILSPAIGYPLSTGGTSATTWFITPQQPTCHLQQVQWVLHQPLRPAAQGGNVSYAQDTDGSSSSMTKIATAESLAAMITNLSSSTRVSELSALLSRFAKPVRVDMPTDVKGKNKGTAVAYFGTNTEVQKVIKRLNNYKLGGKHLHIRVDKSSAVTAEPASRKKPPVDPLVIIDSSSQ